MPSNDDLSVSSWSSLSSEDIPADTEERGLTTILSETEMTAAPVCDTPQSDPEAVEKNQAVFGGPMTESETDISNTGGLLEGNLEGVLPPVAELGGLTVDVDSDASPPATPPAIRDTTWTGSYRPVKTPLIVAVEDGGLAAVKHLVRQGVDMESWDMTGETALHKAARGNRLQIVKFLANSGARLDAWSKSGSTPLHVAIDSGNTEMIQTLLELGADPSMPNPVMGTAIQYAFDQGKFRYYALLEQWCQDHPEKHQKRHTTAGPVRVGFQLPVPKYGARQERSSPSPDLPGEQSDKRPLKGILKQPSAKFPEPPAFHREGVAPHKNKKTNEVPPGARWTRISRKVVNPEALTIGKERFEVQDDFVIVLRVLDKEEIQGYAEATRVIRGG